MMRRNRDEPPPNGKRQEVVEPFALDVAGQQDALPRESQFADQAARIVVRELGASRGM
jgi:hypothetical protein